MNTSNTNAHTPGPWHVEKPTTERKKGTFATLLTGVGGRGFPTCEFEITSENYKNSHVEANAVLIAAAPELLDALADAVDELEQMHRHYYGNCTGGCPACVAIDKARAAIAGATAE